MLRLISRFIKLGELTITTVTYSGDFLSLFLKVGETLKMLVAVTGHLLQEELRSQLSLDNGKTLKALDDKEAAVGIKRSSFGKHDCVTNKSFAY